MGQKIRHVRILAVDDSESDRQRLVRLLNSVKDTHYTFTFAESMRHAEQALERSAHDICLLDFHLGEYTALDVLNSEARRHFAGPVVVLTGDDSYELDLAVMAAGSTDFLAKDSLTSVLLERVIRYSIQQFADRQRFRYLSEHDQVTGLLNRRAVEDWIDHKIDGARSGDPKSFVVLYADLDGFKRINDMHGHDVGDRTLVAAAMRLRDSLGRHAQLGRVGGDEFVAILDTASIDAVNDVMAGVLAAFRTPFTAGEQELRVTISIGAARFPDDASDRRTLITQADAAMYGAKQAGRERFQWASRVEQGDVDASIELGNQLQLALDREQLYLVYQPQFDLDTGRIVALEALARWQHPRLGAQSPSCFVALAMKRGFIDRLSAWVLDAACRQYLAWRENGLIGADVMLAVNMPIESVNSDELLINLRRQIDDHRMPSSCLELEFSETSQMYASQAFDQLIMAVKALGVRISIDDIGRGRSTLSSFTERALDVLKIDLQCLRGVTTNEKDQAMARAIIALGATLGMRVVAEGVESDDQRRFLAANSCRFAQGFYYAPGLATPDMTEMLVGARGPIKPDGPQAHAR